MMRFLVLAGCGLAVLCLIDSADASGCKVVSSYSSSSYSYRAPTYYAPYVSKKVVYEVPVIQKYIAVVPLVEYPTYSAVYAPPVAAPHPPAAPGAPAPQAPAAAPQSSDIQVIINILKNLDARIQRLEGDPQPSAPAPAPPAKMPKAKNGEEGPPGSASHLYNKCASCHGETSAEKEGGNFVMFKAGRRIPLTDGQKNKIGRMMRKGEMPPKDNKHKIAPITDEEYSKIADEIGI